MIFIRSKAQFWENAHPSHLQVLCQKRYCSECKGAPSNPRLYANPNSLYAVKFARVQINSSQLKCRTHVGSSASPNWNNRNNKSLSFQATELINNELPADYSETTVTIVVMDEDDQLPMFNQNTFHLNVSENIGN